MSTNATTPTQPQTPVDPRLAALQAQTAILSQQQQQQDARLKIQQDQQGSLTNMLPASTAAPQSGAVTVSGNNPFDSQKLAYTVLQSVAGIVAQKVTTTGPVLIYDATEMNSLVNYQAVSQILNSLQEQISELKTAYSGGLGPEIKALLSQQPQTAKRAIAAILIPGLLLGSLKTLSDLMGMFRTNTSIAFSSFTADDVALVAAVVNELIAAGKTVYEPAVMPLGVIITASNFSATLSQVQKDILELQQKATVGQAQLQQLSDALGAFIQADQALQANSDPKKNAELTAARATAARFAEGLFTQPPTGSNTPLDGTSASMLKSHRDQFLKELGLFVTTISAMVSTFNTFQTSLMAVTNTGSAAITAILRAEKLMEQVETAGASILLVKTSVLGGSVVTRLNMFSGGHLLYTGGAVVNYTLFEANGRVIASGVVSGDTAEKKDSF